MSGKNKIAFCTTVGVPARPNIGELTPRLRDQSATEEIRNLRFLERSDARLETTAAADRVFGIQGGERRSDYVDDVIEFDGDSP
jgi:hypothetical protein